MDTTHLQTALETFAATVAPGGFGPAESDTEWGAELVVAHVIASNRGFTMLAADLLAGGQPSYDNRAAGERALLESIVAAAGGWDELVTTLRRSSAELLGVAARTDDSIASRPIPSVIHSGDAIVAEGPSSLEELLGGHATVHQQLHLRQLESLRTPSRVTAG